MLSGCSDGDDDSEETRAGELSVYKLQSGDCFNDTDELTEGREVKDIALVPCTEAHDSEVFATIRQPDGTDASYPGDDALEDLSQRECLARLGAYVGAGYQGPQLGIATIGPRRESWEDRDDRGIVCILFAEEGLLTGSQKGSPG